MLRARRFRRLAFRALLALVAAGLLYVVWLDFVITRQFTDRGWEAPTQVYARPLALHAGLSLTAESLAAELERLGYRRTSDERPGTYRRDGGRFDIHLRKAQFADRIREPARVRIVANSRGIGSVQDASGRAMRAVLLEPQRVGSLYPLRGEDRIVVSPAEVPELLPAALKAIEDRRFDTHAGVDLKGILRAAWVNLRAGRVEQGGSTLTQQLVKSYFMGEPRTFWRKAREAIMAVLLELRIGKPQLMNVYINEIYLGQDGDRAIHGFGLASEFYFGKPIDELDLAEIALLVGIVRGPSYYNPRSQPERAMSRRNFVLATLAELSIASGEQAAAAAKRPLGVVPRRGRGHYPAYLELVRRQLRQDYDESELEQAGLKVFTSLDPRIQAVAERAAAEELPKLDARSRSKGRSLEAALVVAQPDTGEIVALVGGRKAYAGVFNHALDARRPIGSLVKPIVYLTALETGQNHAATILNDGPVEVRFTDGKNWRPQNFDRDTLGPVPLVRALAESRNLPTVQLGLELGLAPVARKFRALGLDRTPPLVPSLLLGAIEMTPVEVAQIYSAFANGGMHRPLTAIQAVVTSEGMRLTRSPRTERAAADPVAVYQLNRILVAAMTRGTGRAGAARLPADLVTAGKSGTSSDLRDSWFAGFSGSHVVVAWVGHDDNAPTGLTGSQGALPLWASVMGAIGQRPWHASLPARLEEVWIDYASGLVPDPDCGQDLIAVAVPRNTILEHAESCHPTEFETFVDRFRDWWRRVTD